MSRVAIYARVSSERQEQDATIDSQIASLRELAQKQNDTVVEVYRDDGYSGELLARPSLDRLRDDAAKKLFDRVLILAPDRLARKLSYAEVVADELQRHGVTIQYLNFKNDGTAEGDLLLGVMGKFAEYEKAKILERSRRGKLHKARMGQVVTGQAPYGYRYVPRAGTKPGYFEINSETAANVRLILDLYVGGQTVSQIVRELACRNIPPPCRFGARAYWAKSTIKKILRCETYTGIWHYQKYRSAIPERTSKTKVYRRMMRTSRRIRPREDWVSVPGIPPIIDRSLFDAVRAKVVANTVFSPRNSRYPYLLRGLLRCGECGRPWQGTPCHGKPYYRCTNRQFNFPLPRTCPMGMTQAPQMDGRVWSALKDAFQNPDLLLSQIPIIENKKRAMAEDTPSKLEALSRRKDALSAAEGRLLEALTAGVITLDQLKSQMGLLAAKQEVLKTQEAELQNSEQPGDDIIPSVHAFCIKMAHGLEMIEKDFSQKQALVRLVVQEVGVYAGQLRIKGAIPSISAGSIADMQLGCYGHKKALKFEILVAA